MSVGAARPPASRRYGQHHLVDAGTLQAILAMAAVRPDDVVLEVGAGGGLLTRPLLARAGLVHAFEIDRRFTAVLEELAAQQAALLLHFGDALKVDLSELEPAPTALVANLAYNIAIPLIVRSLAELPLVRRWAVMVQRELGERLFARPSSKAYSAVSVLVQLHCELEATRPVPRSVFSPRPRVDSSFVVFARRREAPPAAAYSAVERLVRIGFGQRRKMMANSLAGASYEGRTLARDDVRGALTALGLPPAARPEELAPPQFVALARELGWT